jgi:hypothetical protein
VASAVALSRAPMATLGMVSLEVFSGARGGLDGPGGLFSGGAGGGSLSAGRSDLFKQFQEGPR